MVSSSSAEEKSERPLRAPLKRVDVAPSQRERPLGAILKDLVATLFVELRQDVKSVTHKLMETILFFMVAVLGALSLLISLIIAFGNQIDHRYDLSALVIGLILFVPGSLFARKAFNAIKRT